MVRILSVRNSYSHGSVLARAKSCGVDSIITAWHKTVVQLFGLVSFMMTVNELSNYLQEHQSFPTSRYKIHYDLGFYAAILLFIATNMAAVITSFNLDGEIGRDRENGLFE
ncbi:hypothetical protein HELRODRAFT_160427 [Helobdella robusta]|uniref:Uncharacterized protein n=1 Tax=Helobdella robusta TaxID=6412 RepID=T1EQ83_HELRO|nr:hypothetical protein HELRODRAFT_160427 [Helobdella robusta]ESO06267.1 hypothetical protein HELRODRAFT_160427 [Helobdella robusta]